MTFKSRIALLACVLTAGCNIGFPRLDFAYRGNGDEGMLEFMRGNYMSSAAGVAKYLKQHLETGLQPGQVVDKAYLVRRGAICTEGKPVVCTFRGIANEYFSRMPKENAMRARRVTRVEARVLLLQPVKVEVVKEEWYPDEQSSPDRLHSVDR